MKTNIVYLNQKLEVVKYIIVAAILVLRPS